MFEKFSFPINAVYNHRVKEGGVKCGGAAKSQVLSPEEQDVINKGVCEWHDKIESKKIVEVSG